MKKLLATVAMATLLISGASLADGHKAKMEAALAKLPAEKAELVKSTFKEMRTERKANKQAHKSEREVMKQILTAPEFNRAAFVGKAQELSAKHGAMKVKGAEKIANLATQLNQEERKILAEMLPKKGKKGKRGGKKRD